MPRIDTPGMRHDRLDCVERVLGARFMSAASQRTPSKLAAADFLAALAEVAKSRMLEHDRVDLRRIDAGHEQPAIQQRLARAARCAADLDALVAGGNRQAAPQQRLLHLGVRPRDGMLRQSHRNRAAGPALRRRHRAVITDPPLVRLDDDDVEHAGVARRRPRRLPSGCCRNFSHDTGAAARIALSISAASGVKPASAACVVASLRRRAARRERRPSALVAKVPRRRCHTCRAEFANSSPVTLPSEMPCVRANVQLRSARLLVVERLARRRA